jgi:UDP-N-acetyl-D-mannosaminuronic acid dehydrogenase
MLSRFNKMVVMGIGQLGVPVAKYVKERGFDTYGYDSSAKALDCAEKTAEIKHHLIAVLRILMYL